MISFSTETPPGKYTSYSKIHAALGLDNGPAVFGGSFIGAAPTAPSVFEYLMSISLVPNEIFGSTEACGPHTTNRKGW